MPRALTLLAQMLGIAAAGALAGLGLNPLTPHPALLGTPIYSAAEQGNGTCSANHEPDAAPPRFRAISPSEAGGLCTSCTAGFVDARPASEFAAGHVPNAVHLPPHGHADEAAALAKLKNFGTVVVYDSGLSCNLADEVATHLKSEGLSDVRILEGAWPAWEQLGNPAESGACAACEGRP